MKRELVLAALLLLYTNISFASEQDKFDFGLHCWQTNGSFVYDFHYPNSAQILSKVSVPQNQNMTIFTTKYKLDNKNWLIIKYGETALRNKGRGSDSDWTIAGSDTLTYYGDMDFHGKQTMWSIDYQKTLVQTARHITGVFVGWEQEKTSNEIKNVVYHFVDGFDVGNQKQPDNGSSLDGKFSGVRLGVNYVVMVSRKLTVNTNLAYSFIHAKAYGHWANHSPAWNWIDSSNSARGLHLNAGLNYSFNQHTLAELGYMYNRIKVDGVKEVLNGEMLSEKVDLTYKQHGLYFGVVQKL